jgi:hypothetical protein
MSERASENNQKTPWGIMSGFIKESQIRWFLVYRIQGQWGEWTSISSFVTNEWRKVKIGHLHLLKYKNKIYQMVHISSLMICLYVLNQWGLFVTPGTKTSKFIKKFPILKSNII